MNNILQTNKEESNFFERASDKIVLKYRISSLIAIASLILVLLICWYFEDDLWTKWFFYVHIIKCAKDLGLKAASHYRKY